jgi:hypothetical protein
MDDAGVRSRSSCEVAKLEADLAILDAEIPKSVITEATEPREMRILARGNFLDESGRDSGARRAGIP